MVESTNQSERNIPKEEVKTDLEEEKKTNLNEITEEDRKKVE